MFETRILLVEDAADDATLAPRAFGTGGPVVHHARDGVGAGAGTAI